MTEQHERSGEEVRGDGVILVGGGKRARAWANVINLASALSVVARVARRLDGGSLPGPVFTSLDEALAAFPHARVAAALPPRSGLALATGLALAGREGVVEAPLDEALARLELPASASGVRVAHGLVTLASVRWMQQALARRAVDQTIIEVRGLPEADDGDLFEVLVHGLALVLRWFPLAVLDRAERAGDTRVELRLTEPSGGIVRVRVLASGHRLDASSSGAAGSFGLRLSQNAEEVWSVDAAGRRRERSVTSPPAPVRALAQLLDARGDDLFAAQRVMGLAVEVREAVGWRPIPAARALRAAITSSPGSLGRLGLRGTLPPASPAPLTALPRTAESLELWALRAGVKPVAFITTRPADAERVIASFRDVHVERRTRRVRVGPQDTWVDRRDEGEDAVELYFSRDPALAAAAARLQAEGDPSAGLSELGALMGYPPCCVAAFAAQRDRSNNVANRYQTFSRTAAPGPWPWLLNNTQTMLLPCFPCTYDCRAAETYARAALSAMERVHPGVFAAFSAVLGRPVLYFDDHDAVTLAGHLHGEEVRYEAASVSPGASAEVAALAAVICQGDTLRWTHEELRVQAQGRELLRLARTDPGLGFLAPFGPAGAR